MISRLIVKPVLDKISIADEDVSDESSKSPTSALTPLINLLLSPARK